MVRNHLYDKTLEPCCFHSDGSPADIEEALSQPSRTGVFAGSTPEDTQLLAIQSISFDALPTSIDYLVCVNLSNRCEAERAARSVVEGGASLFFDDYAFPDEDSAILYPKRLFPGHPMKMPEGFVRDDCGTTYWTKDVPEKMIPALLDMHIMSSFRGDIIERTKLALSDFDTFFEQDECFCGSSLVECLSFGEVPHPFPTTLPMDPKLAYAIEAVPPSAEIEALEPYAEFICKMDDIIAIWSNYLYHGISSTNASSPETIARFRGMTLRQIGEMLGIDSAVKSYVAGVELDAIIAV